MEGNQSIPSQIFTQYTQKSSTTNMTQAVTDNAVLKKHTKSTLMALKDILMPIPTLEYNREAKKAPEVEDFIDVVEEKKKRFAFGIRYNTGKIRSSFHEPSFVSSYSTSITGLDSYGYFMYGIINISKRNTARLSFTYSKAGHRQTANEIRWPSMETDFLTLDLYSDEVKFGLDYMYDLFPDFRYFSIKAGGGLTYHHVIYTRSDNFFDVEPIEVPELNLLKLGPFLYKLSQYLSEN